MPVTFAPQRRLILGVSSSLCFLLAGDLSGQPSTVEPTFLPLPDNPGLPPGLDDTPNPLLAVPPRTTTRPEDYLQPLSPFMPGESPSEISPPAPPASMANLSAEQKAILALAEKVAGSVVSIRVWDEFGALLASGVGCFVSADGLILTDASLLSPDFAHRIDYITTTAANGTNHRITGFYSVSLTTGVALLQGDGPHYPPLPLRTEVDFSQPQHCRVVALSEKRGLLLADATASYDDTLAGQGWLALRGEDSPGAVGSPVLDAAGAVIGVVGMKTPLDSWMNFALPIDQAAFETQRRRPPLKPISELPRHPTIADVTKDPDFLTAFNQTSSRAFLSATRSLLRLTKRYPRSAECWSLLGLNAAYLDATPDALACQRRAAALDPTSGLHWHQLAVARLRSDNQGIANTVPEQEEIESLKLAVENNPNDRISWLLLATQHLREGHDDESEDCLRRLTLLAPTYAQGFYLLGFVKARQGDLSGATQALRRCVKLNERSANAWFLMGLVESRLRRADQAVIAFQNSVKINPVHPHAWHNLARALNALNRPTEAAQAFKQHRERVLAKQ